MKLEAVRYAPEGAALVDGLDLEFEMGAITAIVGRSGCGKSTLLRLVAGLRPLDGGKISGVPRRKSFVFQDAALLPWLNLRANVAIPGTFGPIGDIDVALAKVGLTEHAGKLPSALSGGQRMRASLARALVAQPELVLLDEAFAALDSMTRRSVQQAFLALQASEKWTVILVTHELDDAVLLADRVVAVDGPPLRVLLDLPVPLARPRRVHDAVAAALASRLETALAGDRP